MGISIAISGNGYRRRCCRCCYTAYHIHRYGSYATATSKRCFRTQAIVDSVRTCCCTAWYHYKTSILINIRLVSRWRTRVYRYTRYRCRYTAYLVIRQYIAGSSVCSTTHCMSIAVARYFYRWSTYYYHCSCGCSTVTSI